MGRTYDVFSGHDGFSGHGGHDGYVEYDECGEKKKKKKKGEQENRRIGEQERVRGDVEDNETVTTRQ